MKAVIVEQGVLHGAQIVAVSYLEPEQEWDSGFAAWCSTPDVTGDCELVHLDCFIDEHPEAGEGMDLARTHGEAIRNGNGWATSG